MSKNKTRLLAALFICGSMAFTACDSKKSGDAEKKPETPAATTPATPTNDSNNMKKAATGDDTLQKEKMDVGDTKPVKTPSTAPTPTP